MRESRVDNNTHRRIVVGTTRYDLTRFFKLVLAFIGELALLDKIAQELSGFGSGLTRDEISNSNRNPNGSTDELRPRDRRLLREARRDVGGRQLPIELDYPEVDGLKFDATDEEGG